MSVAEAAHRSDHRGRALALWIGFLIVIAAGIGLAWIGAGALRPIVTASGLQFRTIKPGKGNPITRSDAALIDYVLTTDDGSVFDSSENHGGAQPFTMDATFPGFAEAMGRMQEGGEYRFTMPQRLAFQNNPPPPNFPKNSALTFLVRVEKVVPGGAALLQQQMMEQMEQQQQGQQGQQGQQAQPPEQPPQQ